jgi:hypothetical protein
LLASLCVIFILIEHMGAHVGESAYADCANCELWYRDGFTMGVCVDKEGVSGDLALLASE